MSEFKCDGTCAGDELGDCSHQGESMAVLNDVADHQARKLIAEVHALKAMLELATVFSIGTHEVMKCADGWIVTNSASLSPYATRDEAIAVARAAEKPCTRCGHPLGLPAFRVSTDDGERHEVCPEPGAADKAR